MYVLIDITNNRAIAKHEKYRALSALHYIQFANVDATIVALAEGKEFAQFEIFQVLAIAASIQLRLPPGTYGEQIKALRVGLEASEWLNLPFTEAALCAQANKLDGKEDRPFAFNPKGDDPELLRAWHFPPQRNRRRFDSSYAPNFTSGGSVAAPLAPGKPPKTPPTGRPAAPATPAAPKPPRAPKAPSSGPAARPKAGTSTGKVWDIADAALAAAVKDGDPSEFAINDKALRKAVIVLCEQEGINASTASVQFGKWKSSKNF